MGAFSTKMKRAVYDDRTRKCIECCSPPCQNPSCETCKKCRDPKCDGDENCRRPLISLNISKIPTTKREVERFRCETCAYECKKCGALGAPLFSERMRRSCNINRRIC